MPSTWVCALSLRKVLLLFLILMAGCVDQGGVPSENDLPSDGPGQLLEGFELTKCSSFGLIGKLPRGIAGELPPAGWEQNALPVLDYPVFVDRCERISIGELERGPVHLVFEQHTNRVLPQSCSDDAFPYVSVLNAMWTDDEAVAAAFASTGVKVVNATFDWLEAPATMHSVRFGPRGIDQVSYLEFHLPGEELVRSRDWHRMVWSNPWGGVSMMKMVSDSSYNGQHPRMLAGELRAPLLYGAMPTSSFAASGGFSSDLSRSTTFEHYQDTMCNQPISPGL